MSVIVSSSAAMYDSAVSRASAGRRLAARGDRAGAERQSRSTSLRRNSTVNGVANTLRPDVSGPIRIIGEVDRWFDTSVFTAVSASATWDAT